MRNPRRWRNVSLWFFASGVLALVAAWVLPAEAVGDTARSLLFCYGLTMAAFAGINAYWRHQEVRAKEALARGEDILARWQVDPETLRTFARLNDQLNQQSSARPNEFMLSEEEVSDAVEVICGKEAIQIGESIHHLPRRGMPEVHHAALQPMGVGRAYLEFQLYYPGGASPSGGTRPPLRTVLRFPASGKDLDGAGRVLRYYAEGRPGEADFFHDRGDGTDPEDLSACIMCGYQTHQFRSRCPKCGAGIQSKRWSRRFGFVLILCGLILIGLMSPVLYFTLPLLLRPGVEMNGMSFSGSATQAVVVLLILGSVMAFGVTALLYGVWQVFTGRSSLRVIGIMIALVGAILLVALLL